MQIQKQQTMTICTLLPAEFPFKRWFHTLSPWSSSLHLPSPAIKLHPSHTQKVATGGLTFCPQFIAQALQGVGRVPFLQGEPSRHSASHRELHLSTVNTPTVTHPILYLKQISLSFCLSASLPLSLFTCSWCERVSASPGWVPSYEWMEMREGCEREQKRVGRVRKKGGGVMLCSRRMENKRQYHFRPAGFPVGVNWGRVQQKVDS